MNIPKNRDDFGRWLNEVGLVENGVEVGALSGVYSAVVLSVWTGRRLYLVDVWETQDIAIYKEDDGRFNHQAAFEQAKELSLRDPRAILVKGLSVDVSKMFSDGTMDWVYIDANHSYEAVTEDMTAWWKKIRPGGIMCGHDFYTCTTHPFYNQVEEAVKDWSKKQGVQFEVTKECSSWWMPK